MLSITIITKGCYKNKCPRLKNEKKSSSDVVNVVGNTSNSNIILTISSFSSLFGDKWVMFSVVCSICILKEICSLLTNQSTTTAFWMWIIWLVTLLGLVQSRLRCMMKLLVFCLAFVIFLLWKKIFYFWTFLTPLIISIQLQV